MKEKFSLYKPTLIRSLLVVLPVLAVGLATAGDSVQVFNTVTKEYAYGSFFTPVPVESLMMLPPLAGSGALLCFFESVFYLVKKKEKYLTINKYSATVSALCAAVPPMVRGEEMLVLPNPLFPIFMLLLLLVVMHFLKQEKAQAAALAAEPKKKKKNRKK